MFGVPEWVFFIAKYFGSGVIVATAFIHLLSPASDALRNPCLTGPITAYDWVSGIALMTIFVLFLVELLCLRYANFSSMTNELNLEYNDKSAQVLENKQSDGSGTGDQNSSRAHTHSNVDIEAASNDSVDPLADNYSAQLTAILILEFGIIFHSIFIGLTLAVSGKEFTTLYIVIVFHQTFEGLGLGSRLAITPFPRSKHWTPYVLGLMYGFTTPVAIAIGLGLRNTYPPGSATTLTVNGIFDSISAGILIYTGLIELMAHEFMFSKAMRTAKVSTMLWAYALMVLGAGEILSTFLITH
ncbi:hypothetical protein FGG08_002545 [Glutinoglossum americanum]|uniref:Uncharacterized protein n=1 Tax=Glutinoglossum americanum TaxID=1670608 RepID=A0A9P8KZ29_9PEZI|nr:hypothetical protein FGG08_002545 [Glutinoglossum americanum]